MELNKLITVVITVAVGVVLLGSLLAPVAADAATDTETGSNMYVTRMSEIGNETVTLAYTDSVGYYNGEALDFTTSSGTTPSPVLIVADSFIISNFSGMWYYYLKDSTDAIVQIYSTATGGATATATIADGTLTITVDDDTSYTASYSFCYIPDADGDYAYCNSTYYGILDTDDEIVVCVPTRTNCGVATGTLDELTTTFHATSAVEDTDSFTYTASYDEVTVGNSTLAQTSGDLNYIVPYTYTYEVDNEYAALYSAMPALVIVGLILVILGTITTRRD